MDVFQQQENALAGRIERMNRRIQVSKERDIYPFMHVSDEVDGLRVVVNGKRLIQFSSYSYLNLLGHPKIQAESEKALKEFGTGTHGVRFLAGTTRLHVELEQTIARFKQTEESIALPSGYVANLGVISALMGRNDVVISDKLNHASIVDGCVLSNAKFVRFEHNDMESLERALAEASDRYGKLVVVDAVFSMDGDIINLPEVIKLSKRYGAMIMVDEAHSLGVLGETGHGIEEHFGIEDPTLIDIKMGTMSKAIPSIGGYIAGNKELITYLKHTVRPFIFSGALPPSSAAAAKAAFEIINDEPNRVKTLHQNQDYFIQGLRERGFNTMKTHTPIVPIVAFDEYKALKMARLTQEDGIFSVPVLAPAVPTGTDRIRATVTAGHTFREIDLAINAFQKAGKAVGVLPK